MAGDGAMNVTFYNGFQPSCNVTGFSVTGGNLAQPFPIVFDSPYMNSELPILADGMKYKIGGGEVKCAGGQSFVIPAFYFNGQPPSVSFRCFFGQYVVFWIDQKSDL